jgi:hypothetical protein
MPEAPVPDAPELPLALVAALAPEKAPAAAPVEEAALAPEAVDIPPAPEPVTPFVEDPQPPSITALSARKAHLRRRLSTTMST